MKIYDKKPSDGYRNIVGYSCNSCNLTYTEETLPMSWLTLNFSSVPDEHYCPECIGSCYKCKTVFTLLYVKYWFKNGLCENCQEE